jgi:hypothetical protein
MKSRTWRRFLARHTKAIADQFPAGSPGCIAHASESELLPS